MFAVSRRKVERKQQRRARKQRRAATFSGKPSPKQTAHPVQPARQKVQVSKPTLKRAASADTHVARKRQKESEEAQDINIDKLSAAEKPQSFTRPISVLLQEKGQEAMQAEEAFQRQLAKKLGIKGKAAQQFTRSGAQQGNGVPGDVDASSDGSEDADSSRDDSSDDAPSESDTSAAEGSGKEDIHYLPKDNLYGAQETSISAGTYVPPALRARVKAGADGGALQRRVKGLLNRLAASNLQGIASEVAALMQQAGRLAVGDLLTDELLQAVVKGPRASAAFCGVTAAFFTGLAASLQAPELGARFAEATAMQLEAARLEGDTLACRNLVLLLGNLCMCGLLHVGILFSLLATFTARFDEEDVVMMHGLLGACGFHLRSQDPSALKDFIVAVHARAASSTMTQRARLLLDLIIDIKNNRKHSKSSAKADAAGLHMASEASLEPPVKAWLSKVDTAAVQLHGLSWDTLISSNKKGLWWLPGASRDDSSAAMTQLLAESAGAGEDGTRLLKLAAQQRLSTDVQRAAFCCLMGASDPAQAAERLLRLPLKGEAERTLVTVTVDCCLREAAWNPYYAHVLARLAAASKGHRTTLRVCMADRLKRTLAAADDLLGDEAHQEGDAVVRRRHNLACLLSTLLADRSLSMAVLKGQALTARRFWNAAFLRLFERLKSQERAAAIFSGLVRQPGMVELAGKIVTFLNGSLLPHLIQSSPNEQRRENLRQTIVSVEKLLRLGIGSTVNADTF
ncbi:hypothetical protein WJX73_007570 [Symbiochloris irregularis]|uniref:MI domain-containing protein n=1 Tax=Symbiochloris irregularis TaxID=706552 RepID=A0AAW1PZ90_9CHLO